MICSNLSPPGERGTLLPAAGAAWMGVGDTPAPVRRPSCGRPVSVGRRGLPNSASGRDSAASGSIPDLPPVRAGAGGLSLNSPPAALSQIITDTVSPIAILTSGGWTSFLKRSANLSFGWAIRVLTTRSSTGTTSKRMSPPARPCSRTSLVDGPALGIHEHPPTDRAIKQKRKTAGFIGLGVPNQSGKIPITTNDQSKRVVNPGRAGQRSMVGSECHPAGDANPGEASVDAASGP